MEGQDAAASAEPVAASFPSVTRSHIMNCSFHSWHPRYRTITPKARLVPLTPAFIEYLRADGIIVPPDPQDAAAVQDEWSDGDSGIFSSAEDNAGTGANDADDSEDDETADPSTRWPEVHAAIAATITELGGNVLPKLNWSAPKDATWINTTNTMECRSPNDVYLLLKSSDFISHDLEHVFDDTVDDEPKETSTSDTTGSIDEDVPYHLILRKTVPQFNPALEFRCFVRRRRLIAITQREQTYFPFLASLRAQLRAQISLFFETRLRDTFPDENFVFDVYVPPPHERVWLVDMNPWARRTDPLLFEWWELLAMSDSWEDEEEDGYGEDAEDVHEEEEEDKDDDADAFPPFRLIKRDDPEAYSFATQKYSAHKLPLEVVAAAANGEQDGMRDFASKWKDVLQRKQVGGSGADSSDEDDDGNGNVEQIQRR